MRSVVNDFSIHVATVNGSGSQTANSVLLRAIFQMGIPVSGKNLFPSNIAGLPTWYTIRASKRGYIARKKEVDFLVAMNPETAKEGARETGVVGARVELHRQGLVRSVEGGADLDGHTHSTHATSFAHGTGRAWRVHVAFA